VAVAVALGTLLNPLNSSMIAVALVALQHDFGVGIAASSWLVSAFYLAASVAQPLTGRLADRLGPRRVFCAGLAVVGVTGVVVLFAPGFGWVLACRVLQAIGSSAAFPAGLALLRRLVGDQPPAGTLGTISATNSASAAFGPVLGGLLVAVSGWQAIFAVNIPVTAIGLVIALRWLPADPPADTRGLLRDLDLPGVAAFSVTVLSLLGFLLSVGGQPRWPLLALVPLAGGALVWRELRVASPFLDLRGLAGNLGLVGVLGQQIAVQAVFYAVFFGLPMWLERVRGYPAETAGLLMLPVAALGVVLTPVAAWLVRRFGAGPALLIGSVGLLVGSALLLLVGDATPIAGILGVSAVLGLPNAFNNMGLQTALYATAPASQVGTAAGLFQTSRYFGAILSTALLGVAFNRHLSSGGLHRVALVAVVVAALLLIAAGLTLRRRIAARAARSAG
jgi:MFS family permease